MGNKYRGDATGKTLEAVEIQSSMVGGVEGGNLRRKGTNWYWSAGVGGKAPGCGLGWLRGKVLLATMGHDDGESGSVKFNALLRS